MYIYIYWIINCCLNKLNIIKNYIYEFLCVYLPSTANTDRTHTTKNKNKTLLNYLNYGGICCLILFLRGSSALCPRVFPTLLCRNEMVKISSFCFFLLKTQIVPVGGGGDGVSPGDQQPPVVSGLSGGDVVVDLLHANGGVGNSCAIPEVRDGALNATVNLQTHSALH